MGQSKLGVQMNRITKMFCCDQCGAKGFIVLKTEEYEESDIVYCPICSADIQEGEVVDFEDM